METTIPYEIRLDRARKTFDRLESLGCHKYTFIGREAITYKITPQLKLNASQTSKFAQAIRQATLLEGQGILTAHIDRMGEVIGWYIRKES